MRFGKRTAGIAIRSPLEALAIKIFDGFKASARKEVGFYGPEIPFGACLSIGVPNGMRQPLETIGLGKGQHSRMKHSFLAGPVVNRQVRVVNHTGSGGVSPITQGFVKEAFHAESVKRAVKLDVAHFAVAQIQSTTNHRHLFSSDLKPVERRIVLHFVSRHIRDLIAAPAGRFCDTRVTDHSCEGGISDLEMMLFDQDFVDALDIALTTLINLAKQLGIDFNLIATRT